MFYTIGLLIALGYNLLHYALFREIRKNNIVLGWPTLVFYNVITIAGVIYAFYFNPFTIFIYIISLYVAWLHTFAKVLKPSLRLLTKEEKKQSWKIISKS